MPATARHGAGRILAAVTASANSIRRARFEELSVRTLHDLLRLRAEVFVVEQRCAYLDPDGRDVDEDAVHWWVEDPDGAVVACLRQLRDPDGATRLGRIATSPARRGEGLAARLIEAALDASARPVVLSAQAHLARWYRRFGFEIDGELYVEDGIDHLPMRLR